MIQIIQKLYKSLPVPIWFALGILILGGVWLMSGNNKVIVAGDAHNAEQKNNPNPINLNTTDNDNIVKVKVSDSTAQTFTPIFATNGITQPNKIVAVKSAISARVQSKNFAEFAWVKKGQLLLQLDPQSYPAALKSAEELLNLRTTQYDATKKLYDQGYASNINLTQITAELAVARANYSEQQRINNELQILSPFDGVITQSMVEIGDFVAPAQPIVQLASLDPIYVDIDIPASQLKDMGAVKHAKLTYNNQNFSGELLNISETGDATTRTMRIRFSAPNPKNTIKGQVGVGVEIQLPTQKAHKIQKSILGLNDSGILGVKTIEQNAQSQHIVVFTPITTLSEDGDYIWVAGLRDNARIITDGAAFVNQGARVEIGE